MRVRVASKEYGETRRVDQQKNKNPRMIKNNARVRRNPLRDLPQWLDKFTENLVDENCSRTQEAPTSSSRESASEPRGKVVSGKHSVNTHFPKDRGLLAEDALAKLYLERKNSVTW